MDSSRSHARNNSNTAVIRRIIQVLLTLVRLQTDRDHTVATGGPYRFVRHPGYVGYVMMSAGTPVALGSLWGLVFSGMTAVLLIVRTVLEDRTLRKELEGYADYSRKVKYRLLPFIW
jgi:protein-S-isoprenylcysteine O-methyltransferase Ste14